MDTPLSMALRNIGTLEYPHGSFSKRKNPPSGSAQVTSFGIYLLSAFIDSKPTLRGTAAVW